MTIEARARVKGSHIPKQITCVSAGQISPKKSDNAVARSQLYLNYGLLGLASVLQRRGWVPTVTHGTFEDPNRFFERQVALGRIPTHAPLLLSVPSSFALQWSREFVSAVKCSFPEQRIIVGGRWVTADDANWIRRQLGELDLVVFGTAESTVHDLMFPSRWGFIPGTEHNTVSPPVSPSPTLNYRLLDGFDRFTPSFEVSRGCGRGCNFCAEAEAPLQELKDAKALVGEIGDAMGSYGREDFRAYLEASFFCPGTPWIREFQSALASEGISLKWRTETRVDSISPKQIELLAKSGLRILDLGLESASPSQILNMGKSGNPDVYLRKATEVLKACADNGVWAKVNVLLYPGETTETFRETTDWLEHRRAWIKGLSVGPTIVFRYGASSRAYLEELEAKGAIPVATADLDSKGHVHLHLSSDFPHDRALEAATDLSQSFMSIKDYYDLKAFSYLPRGMTFGEFCALAKDIPRSQRSFSMEDLEDACLSR